MKKISLLVIVLLLSTANAWATQSTTSYSSTLRFGEMVNGSFTTSPLYSGELSSIYANEAAMKINGATPSGSINAVTLYLGIFGGTGITPLPTINGITGSFVTDMIKGQNAYALLGESGANNSQSWTNWSQAYSALISPVSDSGFFGLYKFNMGTGGFGALSTGGVADLEFNPDLKTGTFLFGDADFIDSRGNHSKVYTDYVTPFTTTGFVPNTPVPEPSTFILLGAGLAGLGLVRRRTKK